LRIGIWIVLCGLPATSQAAFDCASPALLRQGVKACDGNSSYSDAARICEDRYEAEIAAARTSLAQALTKVSSSDKQAKGLDNAKAGYDTAIARLRELVSLGKKLQAQIDTYKNEVVLPEDFGSVTQTGFSAKVFLDNNPCYKSTQDLLKLYSSLMGSRAQELELTAKIAQALASKAFKGEVSLTPEEIMPLLTNPKAPAGGKPTPAGRPAPGKSDITGTKPPSGS